VKRFRAPKTPGNRDLFVSDIMNTVEPVLQENMDVKVTDLTELPGKPPLLYGKLRKAEMRCLTMQEKSTRVMEKVVGHLTTRMQQPITANKDILDMLPDDPKVKVAVAVASIMIFFFSPQIIYLIYAICYAIFSHGLYLLTYPLGWIGKLLLYFIISLALIVSLPRITGWLLTTILKYTAMNGFPLIFETVHIQPWMKNFKTLQIQIKTENVKFGNSPEIFQNTIPWFLVCEWLSFRISIDIEHLFCLIYWPSCKWSPFPSFYSTKKNNLGRGNIELCLSCKNLPTCKRHHLEVYFEKRRLFKSPTIESANPLYEPFKIPMEKLGKASASPIVVNVILTDKRKLVGKAEFWLDELRAAADSNSKMRQTVDSPLNDKKGAIVYGPPSAPQIKLGMDKDTKIVSPAIVRANFGTSDENMKNFNMRYCSVIDFDNIDFKGVTIQFAERKGVFNINGFTKDLAKGECRAAVERVFGPKKWPNRLRIRVIRARGLRCRGDHLPNVRVHVALRSQTAYSRLHKRNDAPLIDESFNIRASDPSTVIHVSVVDEGGLASDDRIIGQWVMTLKWFYLSPFFNHHNCMEVDEKQVDENGDNIGYIIKGWFPLLDDKLDVGKNGEIELWMNWTYVPEDIPWKPKKLTALQQLTENSGETTLRLGHVPNVMRMLRRFPILLNVERIVIRDIKFYLRDLFGGEAKDVEKRKAIKIPVLDIHGFKKKYGAPGLTLEAVVKKFILGVTLKLKGSTISTAATQITGGIFAKFGGLFASYKKDVVMHEVKSALFNIDKMFTKPKNFLTLTAFDHDYWLPITIEGIIEIRIHHNWKEQKAMIRGNTLFYYYVKKGHKMGVTHKLELCKITSLKIATKSYHELDIEIANENTFKMRVPAHVAKPTLNDWERHFIALGTRTVKSLLHVEIERIEGLPALDIGGGADPYCVVQLSTQFGTPCTRRYKTSIKSGRNVQFNEDMFIWPVDECAHTLDIMVYDHDLLTTDDFVGCIRIPISSINRNHAECRWDLADEDGRENPKLGTVTMRMSFLNGALIQKNNVVHSSLGNRQERRSQNLKSIQQQIREELKQSRAARTASLASGTSHSSENTEKPQINHMSSLPSKPSKNELTPIDESKSKRPARSAHHQESASAPSTPNISDHPAVRRRSFKFLKNKSNRIQQLISANQVMKLLDKDGSGGVDAEELQPLMDIPDAKLQKSLNKFFLREGLDPSQIDAKKLKNINAKTLKKLLGDRAEYVHQYLLDHTPSVSRTSTVISADEKGETEIGAEIGAENNFKIPSPIPEDAETKNLSETNELIAEKEDNKKAHNEHNDAEIGELKGDEKADKVAEVNVSETQEEQKKMSKPKTVASYKKLPSSESEAPVAKN